ncbi:thermonuclease family protein [Thermosulfurimonas dismutans]|uniref:thermonuclease family protein n=1 Tax=Thermosulfurimonas dismutans TaxID=999894 RepID=UPI00137B8F0A|nr:thermonuclease family protein [Thermosulfurimonas dismutans]
MIGIDTPENRSNKRAKKQARNWRTSVNEVINLGKKAKTRFVLELDVQILDRYGRVLGYVWLPNGEMLNEKLIREGWAVVYTVPPNVKYVDRLLKAQRRARQESKGLWGF